MADLPDEQAYAPTGIASLWPTERGATQSEPKDERVVLVEEYIQIERSIEHDRKLAEDIRDRTANQLRELDQKIGTNIDKLNSVREALAQGLRYSTTVSEPEAKPRRGW